MSSATSFHVTRRLLKTWLALVTSLLVTYAAPGAVTYINFSDLVLTDPNPATFDHPAAFIEYTLGSGTVTHTNSGTTPYLWIHAVDDNNGSFQNAFRQGSGPSLPMGMTSGVPITAGTLISSASVMTRNLRDIVAAEFSVGILASEAPMQERSGLVTLLLPSLQLRREQFGTGQAATGALSLHNAQFQLREI